MFLAEEAATASKFQGFDIFVILFTLVIAWGFIRSITAKERNLFAIGFGAISLIVFLVVDVIMVLNWMGILGEG